MTVELLFNLPPALDAALLFGEQDAQQTDATLVVTGSFDDLVAAVRIERSETAQIAGAFPPLVANVQLDGSPTILITGSFLGLTGAVTIEQSANLDVTGQFQALVGTIGVVQGRDIQIAGSFPDLTGTARVARPYPAQISGTFDDMVASVLIVRAESIEVVAAFDGLAPAFEVSYNPQVARPTVGQTEAVWSVGTTTEYGSQVGVQVASKLPVGWADNASSGTPITPGIEHRLSGNLRPYRGAYDLWAQDGTGLSATVEGFTQDADRSVRQSNTAWCQDATPVRYAALQRFQDCGHGSRAWRQVQYQEASQHKGRMYTGSPKSGTAFSFARNTQFQEARVPPPGISKVVVPVVPPVKVSADLLFSALWDGSAHLVFGDSSSDGGQTVTLFILPARFYMVVHTLIAHRLPDLVEVPLFDASVASDMGSFCWSLQASGPKSLFSLLQPENNLPVQLRVTLDGIPFVFAVDSLSRSNAFGKTVASISGRSVTALIGEPYWRAGIYSNTEDRTAQQLAMDALVNTGIDLDWGIGDGVGANGGLVDWLVPAGALSHQGSPLSVVQRIAQAAGGYLQSHRSTTTLLTRHPYGARSGDVSGAPWDWYAGAADVELAADAVITDAVSRVDGADINAVYVSGTTQGVNGFVKRAGSAADKLAPMVSDALITDAVAARQRGLAILGAAGHKHTVRVELPVLTGANQPGILDVGQLVQVNTATPWRGRVRAVSVASKWPSMRQSVTLERHLEVA